MAEPASLSRRRLLLAGLAALLSIPQLGRAALAKRALLRRFAVAPLVVPRTAKATKVLLNVASVRGRLATAAASPRSTLLLRLGELRTARPPGAVWRVYLAPPGTSPRAREGYFVGSVALFGDGVGARPAATVELTVDAAMRRTLPAVQDLLELGFVPTGPLRNGRATQVRPAASLRVGELSLWVQHL